mgnify:CR=1 FL=1
MLCVAGGSGLAPILAILQEAVAAGVTRPATLLFGARTQEELPYFGPLLNLPKDFIDIHFAFSRTPAQPKRYVQDAMRERAADLGPLLADPNAYFYVCGLKAMEEGVVLELHDIAQGAGLEWAHIGAALKREGRLHLVTY